MTDKEIMDSAFRSNIMPNGLNLPEQWLWQVMRYLSVNFRRGMPEAEAARQKERARRAFELAQYNWVYAVKAAALWNRIDAAAMAYEAEPNAETARAFYNAVYGKIRRKEENDGGKEDQPCAPPGDTG